MFRVRTGRLCRWASGRAGSVRVRVCRSELACAFHGVSPRDRWSSTKCGQFRVWANICVRERVVCRYVTNIEQLQLSSPRERVLGTWQQTWLCPAQLGNYLRQCTAYRRFGPSGQPLRRPPIARPSSAWSRVAFSYSRLPEKGTKLVTWGAAMIKKKTMWIKPQSAGSGLSSHASCATPRPPDLSRRRAPQRRRARPPLKFELDLT